MPRVPDNLAAYYVWQFNQAVKIGKAGNIERALDICWEIRLRPDLGFYRRALVNLFLAKFADPEVHDCIKFAQETINLLHVLRNDGIPTPIEDERLFEIIEKDAKDLILRYKMEKLDLSTTDGPVNKDPTEDKERYEEGRKKPSDKEEGAQSGDVDPEWLGKVLYQTPDDAVISSWRIEGMYGRTGGSSSQHDGASGEGRCFPIAAIILSSSYLFSNLLCSIFVLREGLE